MITATVRYPADVNALYLDPAAASVHQIIREAGEDPPASGQQGSIELIPNRGRATAAGSKHAECSGEEADTEACRSRPSAQQSQH